MKLGVFTNVFGDRSLEDALKFLSEAGVQAVELGCGGYSACRHLVLDEYLDQPKKIQELKDLTAKYNIEIAALSCHGNAVHPNQDIAKKDNEAYEKTIRLAQQLGVETVITFSGCPGDSPKSEYPNWVTCPWPDDFGKILDYQWNEVLIPYWEKAAAYAKNNGINKVAFEMHPGFCVYNAETMLRLRNTVGDVLGANLDPSHLWWQGCDMIAVIRALGDAIYHFHAKDTKIDALNTGVNGVLDTKHYADEIHRSWIFRSVGYGHDYNTWKDIISNLRLVGYDGVISIEHEDSLMTNEEGLLKAVNFLKDVLMFESKGDMWWA